MRILWAKWNWKLGELSLTESSHCPLLGGGPLKHNGRVVTGTASLDSGAQ